MSLFQDTHKLAEELPQLIGAVKRETSSREEQAKVDAVADKAQLDALTGLTAAVGSLAEKIQLLLDKIDPPIVGINVTPSENPTPH